MHKVKITETVLRDAHQSLLATRMKTEDMMPILEKMDAIGYHSLEMWGGATFDSCLRFLNEDPWDRLRKIRNTVKNTKLQMLLRGQNLIGYKHYADDVVEYFVKKALSNGIDIIRIFDALNDVRNIEKALTVCKKEGGHAQGTVCYTISPVHNLEHFVRDARILVDMGADSICIKDMAGLLLPYPAYELVKKLKENVKVPIQIHTHYTSGVASMTYLKAIEAGADVIDCAISPLSMGTSQPATETMVAVLKSTPWSTGLDLAKLNEIAEYFAPLKSRYISEGLLDIKVMGVDVNALIYQVPGGMLSNLVSQLKQSNAMDKYEEVLKEVPKVREELGYPPLVTPTSQIVGTQAVMNVITGERYKMVPKETKALIRGEYGMTPAPVSDAIRRKILGDEELITVRPADLIPPELDKSREAIGAYMMQEEDILTYTLFPQIAEPFFKKRAESFAQPDLKSSDADSEDTAAVIAAAIAAASEDDASGDNETIRVVKSIKRIDGAQSSWVVAGRLERLLGRIS